MHPEKDDRPLLILRKTRGNRFTLPALLGCLEHEGLSRQFCILTALSPDEVAKTAASGKAIIGFSFMTPQLLQVKEEVERLRRTLGEKATFLAGGAHPTGDPGGTLRLGFDFVFAGESERTFPAFLRQFLEGKLPEPRIISGKQGSFSLSPYPPHSLEQRFFSPIEITRGCLFRCTFCQTPRIFGQQLRHRSPSSVGWHLRRSIPYGYRQIKFISPNAFSYGALDRQGPNLAAIEELLASCRQAEVEGIHFGCYPSEVRPDWVTPEVLQLMKRYCRNKTIVLGAQSGSDSLLAKLAREHTADQALTAAYWIRQAGFMPHVDFVFGFPRETMEDRWLSLRLMERMIEGHGAKIHAHTYLPLPGTPLFQKDPSRLDQETKNVLESWEGKRKLDGWWKEQEAMAWEIVDWRDRGLVGMNPPSAENST